MPTDRPPVKDRVISLGPGLPAIPERLLLAHARGKVLFICGAGVSNPAGLPGFRKLVLDVYRTIDSGVHTVLSSIPRDACSRWAPDCSDLDHKQTAEVRRFVLGDYDVVLGMLERRMEDRPGPASNVRREVCRLLRSGATEPAPIHRALVRLADRGGDTAIVTTNFDLLLEAACRSRNLSLETYSLGSIPRPTRRSEFAGILHIHGALDRKVDRFSEIVLSDRDFGEFYLRRRIVPDFIYDAARLFHLVLVGYSANDPPMRYLLNAVAADGTRFDDLKERFTFFGTEAHDPVELEDWIARGITPIYYDAAGRHDLLRQTLERWSTLSAINGRQRSIDAAVRRIVKRPREAVSDADRDLFEHFLRRSNTTERFRLIAIASSTPAHFSWFRTILDVTSEPDTERTP